MRIIRVTQPLDYFHEPFLVDWKLRVGKAEANRISKAAMKIGTRVDELIKTGARPLSKDKPEVLIALKAYEKWKEVYKPESVVPQVRINTNVTYCGEQFILSGEPDLIAMDTLIDIKVASRISKKHWLQLAAYAWLKEWKGPIGVLRLDKMTGSYEYVAKEIVDEWRVYESVLRMYVYLKENDDDNGDD